MPAAFINFDKAYLINHWSYEGTWTSVGRKRKTSISLIFNSWSKSIHNSIDFIFPDYSLRTSPIQCQYQKCLFQVLSAELNLATSHDASEVYDYSCFIIVVEKSAVRSCQVGSKGSSSIRWSRSITRVHILILLWWPHAFFVDRSHLSSYLVIWLKLTFLDWANYPLWRTSPSLQFLIKNRHPYPPTYIVMRLWVIITKTNQVDPCGTNLWPFIVLSSLKPMENFVCLIHLFVVLLRSITWHAFMSLLLNDFVESITLMVSSSLFIPGPSPSSPCVTTLSMKSRCHKPQQTFPLLASCALILVQKTRLWVHFWLVDKLSRL
jgi:hypothetical protein